MNPLLMLLLQQMASNQNTQQNPLMALLGGNQQQDLSQQLIALLGGVTGQQSNAINPQLLQILMGSQQPQQNQNGGMQQLMQLLGVQQQPQQSPNTDISKLLEALGGQKKEKTLEEQLAELLNGKAKSESQNEDDVLARLQKQFNQKNEQESSEAELAEAIDFKHTYDKFISEHEDMFPDWFDVNQIKEDVDKWAKTATERAQGLAAATSKAFFKNEGMLDLLEERDRKAVKEQILKDGIKSHEIDRKTAWPLIERAVFNKNKLDEKDLAPKAGSDESAIQKYGDIFEQGQKAAELNAA